MAPRTCMTTIGLAVIASALLAPAEAWNFLPKNVIARGSELGMATLERMNVNTNEPRNRVLGKGDMLPMDATFETVNAAGRVVKVSAPDAFCGKKIVLVTMPEAFSPTCTSKHLPSYIRANGAGLFTQSGVDAVAILTTDEPTILRQWVDEVSEAVAGDVEARRIDGGVKLEAGKPCELMVLSDPKGDFCKYTNVAAEENAEDASVTQFERCAMLVSDGKIKVVLREDTADYRGATCAESMLADGLKCKDRAVFIALAEELGLMNGGVCAT